MQEVVARNIRFTESGEDNDSEPLSVMVNITDVASLVRLVVSGVINLGYDIYSVRELNIWFGQGDGIMTRLEDGTTVVITNSSQISVPPSNSFMVSKKVKRGKTFFVLS